MKLLRCREIAQSESLNDLNLVYSSAFLLLFVANKLSVCVQVL